MANQQIAHNFFYSNFITNYQPSYMNVGYDHNIFYSYNTAIAKVIKDKYNNFVTLLSSTSHSPTTQRHISNLRSASPFKVLYVPTRYNQYDIKIEQAIQDLIEELNNLTNSKLTQAKNREAYIYAYEQLRAIDNHLQDVPTLEDYSLLYYQLQNSDEVKKLKATQCEKEKAKAKELKELLTDNTLLNLAFLAYSKHSGLSSEQKSKLKNIINPDNSKSFVWFDNTTNTYQTSQNITISKQDGDLLLKLLKHNKLQHGYQIDRYTVISVTPDIIKIGCHNIPTQNLTELANEV